MDKKYLRVILGAKSIYASECFQGGFAGINFMEGENFTGKFLPTHREFNKKFIPKYLQQNPEKSKEKSDGIRANFTGTTAQHSSQGRLRKLG